MFDRGYVPEEGNYRNGQRRSAITTRKDLARNFWQAQTQEEHFSRARHHGNRGHSEEVKEESD
jgi:hypothetical protein